jgi:ATP-dependent RNA helicase DeaD
MNTGFDAIGLRPELLQTLRERGYALPTPIQSELIPAMLAGRDAIGQSQTGSGKTAAFGLPILQALIAGQRHIQSLIMTPTRELAIQVADAIGQYGQRLGVRVVAVYGGQPYPVQLQALKKGVDVVVGTPGRLLDLIQRNSLDLHYISTLVLDEADEMLSMGFIEDIEAILEATPDDRQTALFSATMPEPILRLAKRYLHDPHSFTMGRRKLTVASVDQRYYLINEADRLATLTRLIEMEPIVSALVFARTRVGTGELAVELVGRGYPAEVLNGELGQEARERVLQRFRDNQIKVLVATDVAARGLDIDHVSHVFNYDLPQDPEVYVHRIGRTGRAGKSGVAISLLTPKEHWFLRKIEAYTKQPISAATLPTEKDIREQRDRLLVEQMMVWLRRGRCQHEREMVAQLVEQGHDVTEIAAAALKLVSAEEKQRPIAPIGELRLASPRPTGRTPKVSVKRPQGSRSNLNHRVSHEKGMVRLVLGSGKADGLSVSHIVGGLSHHADIPGSSIGKIHIEEQTTFVDVPEEMVALVLAKKSNFRIGRRRIDIQRA